MRLHRFYVSTPIRGNSFDISDKELIHQWKSVFRYNVGSQVILFDGDGHDYLCLISSLRNQGATLAVVQKMQKKQIDGEKAKPNMWLCLALIKKDNFELAVQKATELGVSHIVPVLCERSEKKNINMERLEKIVVEASEQSGRGDVPKIHEIVSLPELLKKDLLPNRVVYFDLEGSPVRKITKEKLESIAFFVGPEGGWSENENALFKQYNIEPICLGPQVLRAETASIAVASLLLL